MTEVRWNGVLLNDEREERAVFLALAPMYVTLLSALLLFSCGAAKSAQEITVQVPDRFAGMVQIDPCDAKANKDHVVADAKGMAATSSCPRPGQGVTIVIVRAGQSYRVSPEYVKILRAGDGVPVRIEAAVPSR